VGIGNGSGWIYVKLLLVLGVLGYHHMCRVLLRNFEQLANRRSHKWYRAFNEMSVLMFTAIVIMVVVKPF